MSGNTSSGGARAERAAEKLADTMLKSFQLATDEAFEAELSYVNKRFRENRDLLYRFTAFIKNDMMVQVFLGKADGSEQSSGSGGQGGTAKAADEIKIRDNITRWKHVEKYQPCLIPHLARLSLKAKVRNTENYKKATEATKMIVIKMANGYNNEHPFFTKYFKGVTTTKDLEIIVTKRQELMNEVFADWTYEKFLDGYYQATANGVACSLLRADGSVCDELFQGPPGSTEYQVVDCYDQHSLVTFKSGDRECTVKDVFQHFYDKGVQFPLFGQDRWEVDNYEIHDPTERERLRKEAKEAEKEKKKLEQENKKKGGGRRQETSIDVKSYML